MDGSVDNCLRGSRYRSSSAKKRASSSSSSTLSDDDWEFYRFTASYPTRSSSSSRDVRLSHFFSFFFFFFLNSSIFFCNTLRASTISKSPFISLSIFQFHYRVTLEIYTFKRICRLSAGMEGEKWMESGFQSNPLTSHRNIRLWDLWRIWLGISYF